MKNILIVSGHTNLNDSIANKSILDNLKELVSNAEFTYLDKLYPDYQIDVLKEQEKLVNADIIVLQFPIFWYSVPSIMQKWLEDVFIHGFAHGDTGNKLKEKKLILSFTTGAPESVYHKNAPVGYEIEEFLIPIKATCNMCGISLIDYVYTGGVSYQSRTDENAINSMRKKAKIHAEKVANIINLNNK